MQVPVGQFMPDQADYEKGGSNEALNVIPKANSYGPFPSLDAISAAIGARCQGALFVRKSDGTGVMFAGDATKLYMLSGTVWTDVSRLSGGAYACPVDGRWSFIQFGSIVYAQNGLDAAQQFDTDADANFSAASGGFPTALYMAVVGDFPVVANVGVFRSRAQWGSINNSGPWTPDQATQADYQDFPDGGWLQGVVGLDQAGIFLQEFCIRRGTYVGTPLIFQFSKISENIGATIPGAIAAFNNLIIFCDRSGFYRIDGGYSISPISEQRTSKWFWDNLDQTYMHRVVSAIDPVNSVYMVAFPDSNAIEGNPNHILLWAWAVDRWAHAVIDGVDMIFSAATQQGFTLEELDSVSATIEGVPFSLDSQVWAGIARRLVGGFGTDHKLGFFNGAALAPTVDTTEAEPIPGRKAFTRSVRPMVDGGTPSVAIGVRNRPNDAVVWKSAVPQDAAGDCKSRVKGRYQRARITLPPGQTWTHIMGIDDIKAVDVGDR